MTNMLVEAAYQRGDVAKERRLERRRKYTRALAWNQGWLSRYGTRDRLSYVEAMVINYVVTYGGIAILGRYDLIGYAVLWFMIWGLQSLWLMAQRVRDFGWRGRRAVLIVLGLPISAGFFVEFVETFYGIDVTWVLVVANGLAFLFVIAIGFIQGED